MKTCLRINFVLFILYFSQSAINQNWTVQTSGLNRNGVWMLDNNIGWTVGDLGFIFKTTDGGTTWIPQDSGTDKYLEAIWGVDESNVWAVGEEGIILKYDGVNWSTQNTGSPFTVLLDIWGYDTTNIWTVGTGGAVLKYNGVEWETQTSGTTDLLSGIWGTDESNIWAVGGGLSQDNGIIIKYNGTSWSQNYSLQMGSLSAIMGTDASNIWAVGEYGRIFKFDGQSWNWQNSTTGSGLLDVWAINETDVLALAFNRIYRYNGDVWSLEYTMGGTGRDIWGIDDNSNIWIVGQDNLIVKYNTTTMTWTENEPGTNSSMGDIWASDDSHAWALGGGMREFDGHTWRRVSVPTTYGHVSCIWGLDENNIWAAGETFLKYDGSTWQEDSTGLTEELIEMWGKDGENIWAITRSGLIYKYDGTSWFLHGTSTSGDLLGIWGSGSGKIWAVGWNGTILKFDGTNWSPEPTPVSDRLNDIWGIDDNNIWVIGNNGVILKYDGVSWIQQNSGTSSNLRGIWGVDSLNIWAVGGGGSILRYDGNSWEPYDSWKPYKEFFNYNIFDVWGTKNGIWITTLMGTILHTDINLLVPVDEAVNSNEINIFPNPTKDIIKIEGLREGAFHCQMFDVMGKLQMEGSINNHELDISHLPAGMYFLKIKQAYNYMTKSIIKY